MGPLQIKQPTILNFAGLANPGATPNINAVFLRVLNIG